MSFLSAAYRTERHIAFMIRSVQAQRRPDWELIVVDNGMSDEIAAIVEGFADPRIRLIRHENRGFVGAITSATAVARGRWISVLNSDDAITPDFLDHMLDITGANPSIDALAPDAELLVDGDRVLRRTFTRSHPRMRDVTRPLTLADIVEGLLPYYTALVRREAWMAVGGFRNSWRAEELALWLDLVEAGYRLHVTDRTVGRWRLEAGSITHQPEGRMGQEAGRTAMIRAAVERSGSAEDRSALERGLRLSAYEREWVAFRTLIAAGDDAGARRAIEAVVAARPSRRNKMISILTHRWPAAARRAYRCKLAADRRMLPLTSRRLEPLPPPVSAPLR